MFKKFGPICLTVSRLLDTNKQRNQIYQYLYLNPAIFLEETDLVPGVFALNKTSPILDIRREHFNLHTTKPWRRISNQSNKVEARCQMGWGGETE